MRKWIGQLLKDLKENPYEEGYEWAKDMIKKGYLSTVEDITTYENDPFDKGAKQAIMEVKEDGSVRNGK